MVERTLFTTQAPAIVQDPDTGGVTLGVRWFSDEPGQIVAIRFYKGGTQGGNSHTVRLYSATGGVLATAASSGETSSGWQRVNFATPVPIAANTEYRVAVFWPAGRYSATNNFFTSQFDNPPLHAYGSNNGVYTYAGSIAFPTSTFNASNYFVDPIVEIETAPPPPLGSKTIGRGTYPLREPLFLRPAAPPPPPPPPPPTGRVFYVATTGNDSNPGTQAQPFRNISHVINAVFGLQPGDTVIVMPGVYTEQIWASEGGDGSGPVSWDEPTSVGSGYVTIRSQVQHQALLRPPSGAYSTFNIAANYFCIDGFDVVGGEGHGIQCDGSHHHIKIINNVCHDSAGAGISSANNGAEFLLIEGNVCHGNANLNDFHCSGISVFNASNSSGDTTTPGFRIIVRNNICYNNIEIDTAGEHSDGNGIIIDDFHNNFSGDPVYPYPTLVEGNLCFNNGGKGIQVFLSDHVTVRNNTCYRNNVDTLNPGTWRGELSNAICDNNTWINNIAVCDPTINSNNRAIDDTDTQGGNVNVVWYNNLTFNGTPGQASIRLVGSNPSLTEDPPCNNVLGEDPLFVNPSTDPATDFRPQAGSPALNSGTTAFGVAQTDLDGNARIVGASVDLGCYERQ